MIYKACGGVGYLVNALAGSPFDALGMAGAGAILGMYAGAFGNLIAKTASERRARGKISHLDEYFAGDSITCVLSEKHRHTLNAIIQRELYAALQQAGVNIGPEQFLARIYGQMPPSLVEEKAKELEKEWLAARLPAQHRVSIEGTALQKMLSVAGIILGEASPQPA